MFRLRGTPWLVTGILLALAAASLHGAEAGRRREQGCDFPDPVLEASLVPDAQWRLPLSSERPEIVTEARLSVGLRPPSGPRKNWVAEVRADFPDPRPFGLPYSFEKLLLRWDTGTAQEGSALLDWTEGCSQVGRSLFPGQAWLQAWEIPGTSGIRSMGDVSIRFWGARY